MDNTSRVHHVSKSGANRLVLVDGNAILHRAYHALPPLTSPDGALVNAVYGFTSMLLKIWNDFHPTHMAIAFDRPEPTFRKKLFTGYQAKRPEMDEGLVSQIDKVRDLVSAFGVPTFDAAGFEADDVIGSLVKQATDHQSPEVIIVTGDRDLLQLVDDKKGVKAFMPTKGLSEGKLFGEAEAKERMGVTPTQIPDYKALAGDSSDNYPGVAGIGPKTAADLLGQFGSVENLYQALKKNGGTLKNFSDGVVSKLKSAIESAKLSKELATIRTDAPIDTDLKDLTITSLNTQLGREKLAEFNFKSLLARLTGEEAKQHKQHEQRKPREQEKRKGEQQELF